MNDSPLCPLSPWDFELGAPGGECPRPEQHWPLSVHPGNRRFLLKVSSRGGKVSIAGHPVAQGPASPYARNQRLT